MNVFEQFSLAFRTKLIWTVSPKPVLQRRLKMDQRSSKLRCNTDLNIPISQLRWLNSKFSRQVKTMQIVHKDSSVSGVRICSSRKTLALTTLTIQMIFVWIANSNRRIASILVSSCRLKENNRLVGKWKFIFPLWSIIFNHSPYYQKW